jgi:tripartite-type tricarboxylate transporter receptor subunit TctC
MHSLLIASLCTAPAFGAPPRNIRSGRRHRRLLAGRRTDLIARAIAPFVEYRGGAKIAVVNRAGAGGEIGFAALANSAPDGYTIGFVNTPPLLTIPIERQAQFSWQRFEYLGNIIDDPCNFSVHADNDIKDLKQLAAYAKANPAW